MSAERLNILLVEDNPGDARLFKEALNEAYAANFVLLHYTSLAQALERLLSARPDVIVVDLDYPMPSASTLSGALGWALQLFRLSF